jgi:hypothetical protein
MNEKTRGRNEKCSAIEKSMETICCSIKYVIERES